MDAAAAVDTSWLTARPRPDVPAPPLTLHAFDPAYAASMAEAVNVSLDHLRPWMPWATAVVTVKDEATLLADFARRAASGTEFGYHLVLDDAVVGGAGLHLRNGPGVMEIGYWVHAHFVGRGFASSAARALTHEAFSLGVVDRVEIHCDAANGASAAVPQRLGYSLIDRRPRTPQAPSDTDTELVWAVERAQWPGAVSENALSS
jgi:RimJ/RimL family protein N-acetyltransferase